MTRLTSRSVFPIAANAVWWLTVAVSVIVYGLVIIDVWSDASRGGFGEPLTMFDNGYYSLRSGELAALQELGLNETAYAGFLVLRQLFFFGASLIIAWVIWRRVRTWVALYMTLFLVTGNFLGQFDGGPDLGPVGVVLPGIGFVSLIGLLYVYPDGRHARLFALLFGGFTATVIAAGVVVAGGGFFWDYSFFAVLAIMAGGVFVQLRRILSQRSGAGPRYALLVTYTLAVSILIMADAVLPERADAGLGKLVWRLAVEGAVLGVPLAVGLVIVWQVFRHGLWDVELAINRTAVYATLSALLALVYVLVVVLTQAVLRWVTGIDRGNTFGVIAATALTALLVLPAHRRIQAGIDRVFFRRRYDLARTLTSFSERVENRENLDEVAGDLLAIVDDTFQPEQTVLLLPRPGKDRS
ncbi:MAG: hypothetical protein OES24_05505 [Acidimicrobiia bacterium]|nr:hypothetical protein [Acidimicrobiia bacterium]